MKIQDRAVLVRLSIESWGTTRQDEDANDAVAEAKKSNTKATRVSKRLAPEDTLKAVKSKSEDARKYLRTMTQPWTDDGARLLDATFLMTLSAELRRKYRPAWQVEVDKVIAKLPYFRDTWGPANLGDLYDRALYPTPERMAREFSWTLDILPMNPNSRELRTILGSDYVDELQQKAEAAMTQNLVARITAPIENMVRRLTEPDGTFKDSLVENVQDIAKLIPALNLAGDPTLAALQQRIEADLTAYSAPTLRKSSKARNETAQKAQAILDKMASFMPGLNVPSAPVELPPVEVAPPPFPLLPPKPLLPPMKPADQLRALQIVPVAAAAEPDGFLAI
jgi:prophage DNA circulation protein